MPLLPFISDEKLYLSIKILIEKGIKKQQSAKKDFYKNVIDPFGAILVSSTFNSDFDEWREGEIVRQSLKTVSDKIGFFHQQIIGSIAGWEDLQVGRGLDVINRDTKIIAEVKNKHNTTKGDTQIAVYDAINEAISPKVSQYNGYTGYYVTIIPSRPGRINKPFTPSDNKTKINRPINENIRHVDGATFYEIVTGEKDALEMLFNALPTAIENTINTHFPEFFSKDKAYAREGVQQFNELFNRAFKK